MARGITKDTAKVAILEYGTVRLASENIVDPRVRIHSGIITKKINTKTKIMHETSSSLMLK